MRRTLELGDGEFAFANSGSLEDILSHNDTGDIVGIAIINRDTAVHAEFRQFHNGTVHR